MTASFTLDHLRVLVEPLWNSEAPSSASREVDSQHAKHGARLRSHRGEQLWCIPSGAKRSPRCTFSDREGVLGSIGIYRAAFTSIAQNEPLLTSKISVPVVAMGGANKGRGAKVGAMVRLVATNVEVVTLAKSGHSIPEECPVDVINHVSPRRGRSGQRRMRPDEQQREHRIHPGR